MQDLRFEFRLSWIIKPCFLWVHINVSEGYSASIFRAEVKIVRKL
jgi:hypothetical protein